jgi:uncharacterized membrane-anchored protein YhcB (DUF1043 family)
VRALHQADKPFNLVSALSNNDAFGIEDIMPLTTPYSRARATTGFNMSAKAQSQLFNGLVSQMDYYKDWKTNDFDKYLAQIDAADILDPSGPKTGQKIFNKADFFLLSFAHTASLLNNLSKDQTQFVLLTSSGEVVPTNLANTTGQPITMATAVDIINGQRQLVADPADVARWVISFKKFMTSTQGLEKTKVKELLTKDNEGLSPIQKIVNSQQDLRDLTVAMGNFLASQAIDSNNLVVDSVDLTTKNKTVQSYKIESQLLVMEALLDAYDQSQSKTHLWACFDIYKAMIASYNNESVYFDFAGRAPNLLEAARMVRVFNRLSNYLSPSEKASLKSRLDIWQKKLLQMN